MGAVNPTETCVQKFFEPVCESLSNLFLISVLMFTANMFHSNDNQVVENPAV